MAEVEDFYFDTGEGRIFCTLIGNKMASDNCIIYFAPLFEERMWCQRIAFNCAKELFEETGQNVIMYDYFGYGESDGETEDFSIQRCQRDFRKLARFLQVELGFSGFSAWGIRTGCALALKCLANSYNIKSYVFWAPVLDLKNYIDKELRSTVVFQSFFLKAGKVTRKNILHDLIKYGKCEKEGYILNNIEGYRISRKFYKEVSEILDDNALTKINQAILILTFSEMESKRNSKILDKQENALQANNTMIAKNIPMWPFWNYNTNYTQKIEKANEIMIKWYENKHNVENGVFSTHSTSSISSIQINKE